MNGQCIREVRSLEDRELPCRITGIGCISMVPTQGYCYDNLPGTEIQMVSHITSGRVVLPAPSAKGGEGLLKRSYARGIACSMSVHSLYHGHHPDGVNISERMIDLF